MESGNLEPCLTATGIHMPYRITQYYLPPSQRDIPIFIQTN